MYNMVPPREDSQPVRAADPMSFSNILTSNNNEPPKTVSKVMPAVKQFHRKSHTPNGDTGSVLISKKTPSKRGPSPNENLGSTRKLGKAKIQSPAAPKLAVNSNKIVTVMSDKENEKVKKEMERIDAMEMSEAESPAWAAERDAYVEISRKRQLDVDAVEDRKRKVLETPCVKLVSSLTRFIAPPNC